VPDDSGPSIRWKQEYSKRVLNVEEGTLEEKNLHD